LLICIFSLFLFCFLKFMGWPALGFLSRGDNGFVEFFLDIRSHSTGRVLYYAESTSSDGRCSLCELFVSAGSLGRF